jgi:23S rRNA pseudouridine2605 synthase
MAARANRAGANTARPDKNGVDSGGVESDGAERIAKRLSRLGVCSRREAERMIEAGRITVDGSIVTTPALRVAPGARLTVDGRPVKQAERLRLWRYHKPDGLICTNRDPQGRETIFDRLPRDLPRVITVGRLDLTSEGLLLLTNDGELARRLEHPDTGWTRRYRARVFGKPDVARLAKLARGITLDGIHYGPIEARVDRVQETNAWLSIALREGKNREIRKVLDHLDLKVNRLIRVSFGPFQLGTLAPEAIEEIPEKVIQEQTGRGKADDAGR